MADIHTGVSPLLGGFEINDEIEDIESFIDSYPVKDNIVCDRSNESEDRLKELEELTVEIISFVPSGKRKLLQEKLELWRNKGGISF